MDERTGPMFLARESYRRRRVADAAKLVPLVGLVLLLVPGLWSSGNSTADAIIYVFGVWAVLIVVIGVLSRRLSHAYPGEDDAAFGEPKER